MPRTRSKSRDSKRRAVSSNNKNEASDSIDSASAAKPTSWIDTLSKTKGFKSPLEIVMCIAIVRMSIGEHGIAKKLTPLLSTHMIEPIAANVFDPIFGPGVYDAERDEVFNLCMCGAVLGYICMCSICTIMDFALPRSWTLKLKTQGEKSFFSVTSWIETIFVAFFNLFVSSHFILLPLWTMHRAGCFHGAPLAALEDEFSWPLAIVHCVVHAHVIDVVFYSTHRVLHWGPFYKWIHKRHHKWHAPCAIACVYANPIEFCLGNVSGVFLGPLVTNCHPYTACFWMAFSLAGTSGSHSGYKFLGAENHDLHHEHFDCNYGTSVFMDKLLGTTYEGSPLQERVDAQRAKLLKGKMK